MVETSSGRARPGATAFVLLTVALSWSTWIAAWFATGRPTDLTESKVMLAAVYAGSFAPGLSAATLSAAWRRGALSEWLRSFVRFRCGWRAYAAALLPLPIIALILTLALSYTPRVDTLHGRPALLMYLTVFPVSIVNGLATVVAGAGPLGEEGGWRGYLLPQLLERLGEVRASLIVGIVWALWHLPIMAMFPDWRNGASFAAYLPLYVVGVVGLSFVMTRVWRLGSGSLVPCIWLHGLTNAVGGVAFERALWASQWSIEASTAHFAVVTAGTAALLMIFTK